MTDFKKTLTTWEQQAREHAEKVEAGATAAAASIFPRMLAAGLASIEYDYSGSGDSGQIDEHTGFNADHEETPVPEDLASEGESIANDLLESKHGGWYNGDGASGTVTLNAAERTVVIDHDEYYTETRNEETTIPIP